MRTSMPSWLRATLALATILPEVALAQTAQLTGRIVDSSERVIPSVTVAATSDSTGFLATAVTGTDGYYLLAGLQPGTYTITVERAGFSTVRHTGLVLQIGQTARLDFTMQVGPISATVEVSGASPMIQRDTTSIGHAIDNRSITTLPLNGRDYTQLVTLTPGAVPNQGSRAGDGISLNGARTLQTNYRIDGIDNNNYILGLDTGSTQAFRPSVDSIQEFRIESANFSAQYGNAAGGVVMLVIKSGTNELRGSAFEFFRDDSLDEQEYFSKTSRLVKPPLRYNQFGGTLGGPIVQNRTFFFASYQGTRNQAAATLLGTVPTVEKRSGYFGTTVVYDPATASGGVRTPFPDNTIPADRIDPVATRLLSLIALPNLPGTTSNYARNAQTTDNADQVDLRVDHQLGQASRLFVRYSWQGRTVTRAGLFDAPGLGGLNFGSEALLTDALAWSVASGLTHVVSGTKLNELRVGVTEHTSGQETLVGESLFDDYGITGVPDAGRLDGLTSFAISNYFNFGSRTFTPNDKFVRFWQVNDTFSWASGEHSIKFGGEARFRTNTTDSAFAARGTMIFNGQFTSRTPGTGIGDPFADFLLGLTSAAGLSTFQAGDLSDTYIAAFAEDVWRVTPRLTVNVGLRYEIQTPPVEADNKMSNFDADPSSPTYGTLVPAADGSYASRAFMKVDTNNVSPRLGAAYSVDPKTVIRGAYGVFFGGLGYMAGAQLGVSNPPHFVTATRNTPSTAATSNVILSKGFPAGMLDPVSLSNPTVVSLPEDSPLSRTQQWNLTTERELPWHMAMSLSYIGSRTTDVRAQNDINQPTPGPGALNPRRAFPTFGAINQFSSWGGAAYDGLHAKVERRYANGLWFLTSYTWGHALNDSSDGEDTGNGPIIPQDPTRPELEYSSSPVDVRHRLTTSFIYDLPIGGFGPAAVRAILRDWQVGGVFTAQSGVPHTPTVSPNPANTTGTARPDRLGDGNLPPDQRSIDRWYDVEAFTPAAPFTYGNAGRSIVRAPGLVNMDLLVSRGIQVTACCRLDIRGEFYNITNAVHLGRPEMNILSPNAGRITSTQRPPRQVQIGVRLSF